MNSVMHIKKLFSTAQFIQLLILIDLHDDVYAIMVGRGKM